MTRLRAGNAQPVWLTENVLEQLKDIKFTGIREAKTKKYTLCIYIYKFILYKKIPAGQTIAIEEERKKILILKKKNSIVKHLNKEVS
jgi:hypothetical protein